MRILFLNAHADDSEFCSGNTEIQLAKTHEVFIACMTMDEYGTSRDEFKGKRIARIRKKEMECAAKIVGAKLNWLGFIDGYLPFNKDSYQAIKHLLERIQPDVVFAPEPLFTLDFHNDHVNTGKLAYLVIKHMKPRPLLLYFHSFKSNFYVPCTERETALKALYCHVSQRFTSLPSRIMLKFYQTLYGLKTTNHLHAEGFRIIRFNSADNQFSPLLRFFYWLSRAVNKIILPHGDWYHPTPDELGLT
ncbi:MAG: PIG-L deacetylase family protein [Candidatus Helarchaeota archaeon]